MLPSSQMIFWFIYAEKFRRSMTRWRRRWRVGSTGWEQNTQKRFRHHSQQQFVKDHEKQMAVGGGAGNKDICSTLRQDGHGLPGEEIRGNQPDEEQSCCDCEKTIIWHNSLPFQMKEEVEGEYAERMEGLREIYRWVKWWNVLRPSERMVEMVHPNRKFAKLKKGFEVSPVIKWKSRSIS